MSDKVCVCAEPDPVMQADRRFYCHKCSLRVPAVLCLHCQRIITNFISQASKAEEPKE